MKIVVALCLLVSVARAQPVEPTPVDPPKTDGKTLTKLDTSKVEALFNEGTKHYDLGEWDAAIASFKQAYALMPDASFLYNLGQAYRQKGSCRDATAAYKAYLRNAPDEDRTKVEQFIHELEPCVKAEEEAARRLAPPAPPPQLSARSRLIRRVGYGMLGAGAIGLGVAGYFTYRSNQLQRDRDDCTDTAPCSAADVFALERRGHRANRHAAWAAIIGGSLAVLGGGAVVYTFVRGEYVTVEPARGGAVVTTRVRF